MPAPTFVHLRVYSEYSVKYGMLKISDLIQGSLNDKMPAVALTDLSNLFAAVKFYRAVSLAGIKPILGASLLVTYDGAKTKNNIVVLCQNNQGYKNLIYLISRAYREGQVLGEPLVKFSWLAGYTEGLIVLSGGLDSDIARMLLSEEVDKAKMLMQAWMQLFKGSFYAEVSRIGKEQEEEYLYKVIALCKELQCPLVATNSVCFLKEEDCEAHAARVCINQGITLEEYGKAPQYTKEQYLKNQENMQDLFYDLPQAVLNTVEIAKRCNAHIELNKVYLPNFAVPDDVTVDDYLEQQAFIGLEARLKLILDRKQSDYKEQVAIYKARLATELVVINNMGFGSYFLIVSDFIRYAKQNNIPVGPGRGSGAGSLAAYVLEITDIDPLAYGLLFERFLNPERVSLPDFDIDFCMDKRDLVIEYVAQKYGRDSVSQIITFGTMAAKAVIRDVGRVLNFPYGFVDKIAKLVPFELHMTLEKALEQEESLRQRYEQEDDVRTLIDLAKKLEGIVRNVGKHAGGVVIAPSKLTDFSALYCEEGSDHIITQFDKDDVESIGLVKFDFLGLRTLTIIKLAVDNINAELSKKNQPLIDINTISLADRAAFDLLKKCQTTAVFQLESRGMKDLIARLQPDRFEDIIALVALYRPGPLQSGMVDDFINRKHGRAMVEYPHASLENSLHLTYGVILYQEQVMQIAQELSGYTLGGADLLRRAMGKKKPEEMASQRAIFTDGAVANGVNKDTARYIFDLIEKFAGYGFNKSHSAAYALVSYQTAWLKAHYTAAFMAAVLSSDLNHTDKVVTLIDECRQLKLKVLPPDINHGSYRFTTKNEQEIFYGLGAIKGLGEGAIAAVIEARERHGEFTSLHSFCKSIDVKKVNRRSLEALIRSGAMDCFKLERAQLLEALLDDAIAAAEQATKVKASGQLDLFGDEVENDAVAELIAKSKHLIWSAKERLLGEKETLGLYLTGHPIDEYKPELNRFISRNISDLVLTSKTVTVAGFIIAAKAMLTKRGDKMAFLTIDDATGRLEVAVFSDVYQTCKELLDKEALLIIEGEVSATEQHGLKMRATKVMSMAKARERFAKNLLLKLNKEQKTMNLVPKIQNILKNAPAGNFGVCIEYKNDLAKAYLRLSDKFSVLLTEEVLDELKETLGKEAVVVEY